MNNQMTRDEYSITVSAMLQVRVSKQQRIYEAKKRGEDMRHRNLRELTEDLELLEIALEKFRNARRESEKE